jgi:hypothetical protein
MRLAIVFICLSITVAACVTQQPATDLADTVTGPSPVATTPSSPTTPTTTAPAPTTPATIKVAYEQDLKPVFQSDCVRCHSGSRPDGNYSMSTYAQVMRDVAAGNSRSRLVVTTQRNASMYRYWSGNAAAKAELVRTWVVDNGAAEKR